MLSLKLLRSCILVTCFVRIEAPAGNKVAGQRIVYKSIEASKTYDDQKTGAEAEYALLTLNWGFVDHHHEQTEWIATVYKEYVKMKEGHAIMKNEVPLHLFDEATDDDKMALCRALFDEGSLYDNNVYFDGGADPKLIAVVEQDALYQSYQIPPEQDNLFVRCPMLGPDSKTGQTLHGYYYMTAVEQAENEKDGHYYIFSYNSEGGVSAIMRTMLGSGSRLREIATRLGRTARDALYRVVNVLNPFVDKK